MQSSKKKGKKNHCFMNFKVENFPQLVHNIIKISVQKVYKT